MRQVDPPLVRTNGIRGRYLNQISRRVASELAGAFASLLWEEQPPVAGSTPVEGPTVVVGFDERPSSLDLVTGVALALRRMGCRVVDTGMGTRPSFWFAVHHLHASAGVFVTGSGGDLSCTGLDFVGRAATPLSDPGQLSVVSARWKQGFSRTSRSPATQSTFQAWVPYEAGLWKHFHALRPLKVVVATSSTTVRELLERLFVPLPCQLLVGELPVHAGRADTMLQDTARVGHWVQERQADLGIVIGNDGQQTTILDERGRCIPPQVWLEFLAATLPAESGRTVVIRKAATFEELSGTMRAERAFLGLCEDGSFWFDDPFPTTDAVLTLAKSLQALSRSDARVSEAAQSAGWTAP